MNEVNVRASHETNGPRSGGKPEGKVSPPVRVLGHLRITAMGAGRFLKEKKET